jgi:O-antigen/teichoic acid export membrane protein
MKQFLKWSFENVSALIPDILRRRLPVRHLYKKHYVQNRNIQLASQLAIMDLILKSLGVLLVPVYTFLMTQQDFGAFNYYFSFSTLLGGILVFGVSITYPKLYADCPDTEKPAMTLTVIVGLHVLGLLLLILIFFTPLADLLESILFKTESKIQNIRWSLILATFVSFEYFMFNTLLITHKDVKLLRYYNIWKLILVQIASLSVLYWEIGSPVSSRLNAAFGMELLVLLIFFTLFAIKYIRLSWNNKWFKQIIIYSLPSGYTFLLSNSASFTDRIMLEQYFGFEVIACYSLAQLLAYLLMYLFNPLYQSGLTDFLQRENSADSFAYTQRTVKRVVIVMSSLGIVITLSAQLAIWLKIFNTVYQPSVALIPLFTFDFILMGISMLYNRHILAAGNYGVLSAVITLHTILLVFCNLFFIPTGGYWGLIPGKTIPGIGMVLFGYVYARRLITK